MHCLFVFTNTFNERLTQLVQRKGLRLVKGQIGERDNTCIYLVKTVLLFLFH